MSANDSFGSIKSGQEELGSLSRALVRRGEKVSESETLARALCTSPLATLLLSFLYPWPRSTLRSIMFRGRASVSV